MYFAIILNFLLTSLVVAVHHSPHPIVIIIAFDGFRYDYLDRGFTPVLKELAKNGTTAKYMINQFPTKTYTNFHSISTGMYPETHGVLGNFVFDEDSKCVTNDYKFFHYNKDIVPIWILNEDSGEKRYSGVMMWAGSNFKFQEKRPTFSFAFNQSVSWTRRVDKVMTWLTNETSPANLVLMYFEQPDQAGHQYGPESNEVNQQLQKINLIMKYYLQRLRLLGIRDKINTIVLSDHGMEAVDVNSILNLDDYINPKTYTPCDTSPGIQILSEPGFAKAVYNNLTNAAASTKKFQVYKRQDVPNRWHIRNNPRFADCLVLANMPYVFKDSANLIGAHGYDNNKLQMYPLFISQGPLIKVNHQVQPFQNIDIYPLISYIFLLKAPPVHVTPNGTLYHIKNILRDEMLPSLYEDAI